MEIAAPLNKGWSWDGEDKKPGSEVLKTCREVTGNEVEWSKDNVSDNSKEK